MKHRWEPWPYDNPGQQLIGSPRRRCANCPAVQTRETKTWYMRVVGYSWWPRVGRCKPANNARRRAHN